MGEVSSERVRSAACVGAVLLVALGAGLWSTSHPRFSTDSFRYALVAGQLAEGRGLRTPVYWRADPETPLPDAEGTIPFTLQPPGFPLLLSAVGNAAPDRTGAVRALNLLAHLATCLACLWLGWRLGGRVAGAAAGGLAAVALPSLRLNELVLSEPLFTPAFVGAVALLVAARASAQDESRREWPFLIGTGLAVSAALSLRFAGMALFGLFAWEGARAWRREGPRAGLRVLALTAVLPTIVLALVLTPAMTGRDGVMPHLVTDSLYARPTHYALWGAIRLAAAQVPMTFAAWGLALLAVAAPQVVLSGAWWRARTAETRAPGRSVWALGLDLVVVAALGYVGLLALSLRRLPTLDLRYGAPLAPLLAVAAAVVVVRGWREAGGRRLALGGSIVSLALLGLTALAGAARLEPRPRRYPIQVGPLGAWLRANVPPGTTVASNLPGEVAFFAKTPCMGLPNVTFNRPVPEDMATWLPTTLRAVNARYLVLWGAGLEPDDWGPLQAALSRGEATPPFQLAWRGKDGVVYHIRD